MYTFLQLKRLFLVHATLKALVYVAAWALSFLALMMLGSVSPKSAIWVTKLMDPISGFVKDIFWYFIPEPGHIVRRGGKLVAFLGRKAMSLTSDKTQLGVQLGVLNGLLIVSAVAWVSHCLAMIPIRGWLIRQFLAGQQQ